MTDGARPRLAVLGAGVMGSYHARVIAHSERCELVRVIDPNSDVGRPLAERFGAQWRPEVDRLDDVHAVVVAAPTQYHRDLVVQALDSRVPVLVEKPVSDDLALTELLVGLAEERQVPIMCGFVERFNPAMLTVLPVVTEPVHITAVRHSPYANRTRTGVAWDLLIHDVDACLRFVRDNPVEVRSGLGVFHPESGGGEDVAEAVMTFPSGAVASVSASRIGQRKVRSINIVELGRAIEVDLLRRDVTIYHHVSADYHYTSAGLSAQGGTGYRQQTIIEIPELVSAREPLAAQLDHFLDLVAGRVDMKEERESILPAHRVVARVMAAA
jgi:predicted dehydrogenase